MAKIKLLKATVGHARLQPKKNSFKYYVYYTCIPILTRDKPTDTPRLFSFDRFNVLSQYPRDYGHRDRTSLEDFIRKECASAGIKLSSDHKVELLSHPKLFGYSFNPISYWLISNEKGLRAVLCEVHNTFKQTHNYMLQKADRSVITPKDTLIAEKELFVSPYNTMEGHYEFSFTYTDSEFKSVINYFGADSSQIMNTYMGGVFTDLNDQEIIKLVFRYPFMTLMVVARIHWQAVILFFKRVKPTLKLRPKKDYISGQTTKGSDKK